MGHRLAQGSDERFAAYVEELASVIGHADRVGPLEAYCIGLLLPSEPCNHDERRARARAQTVRRAALSCRASTAEKLNVEQSLVEYAFVLRGDG